MTKLSHEDDNWTLKSLTSEKHNKTSKDISPETHNGNGSDGYKRQCATYDGANIIKVSDSSRNDKQTTAIHHSSQDTITREESGKTTITTSTVSPELVLHVKSSKPSKISIPNSLKNETKEAANASFSDIEHKPFNDCQQVRRAGSRAWIQNISTDHPNYRYSPNSFYPSSFHYKTSDFTYPPRALSDFTNFHRHSQNPLFCKEPRYGRSQYMSYRDNSNVLLNHYTATPPKRRNSESYPSTEYEKGPQRLRHFSDSLA